MVAAPEYGAFTFVGLASGQTYAKDIYFSDVAASLIRWDAGSGASATSPEEWRPPEPVLMRDLAIVTGGTDTKKFQLTRNGVPTGDILRHSVHLNTLAFRPVLNIAFNQGDAISAIQIA